LGEIVAILADGKYNTGYHQFAFNADVLTNGRYIIQVVIPDKTILQK